MRHVAVVGTEGSGKTVFLSVLARKYGKPEPGSPWFNPLGKTLRYVDNVWHTLNEGQWPSSTIKGTTHELNWQVEFPSGEKTNLKALDCAGQDLRQIFTSDQVPEALKPLTDYIRSADLVLFTVNLGDFVGLHSNETTENILALKLSMDVLREQNRTSALLFTQSDKYRYLLEEHGNWLEVAKEILPVIYGAHLKDGAVPVIPVSAVSDTEVVIHKNGDNAGKSERIPAANFRSTGLDSVLEYLEAALKTLPPVIPATPPPIPEATRIASHCAENQKSTPKDLVQQFITYFSKLPTGVKICWSLVALAMTVFALTVMVSQFSKCDKCHGTGKVICSNCNGTGKGWFGFRCGTCDGNGWVICDKCHGTGKIQ